MRNRISTIGVCILASVGLVLGLDYATYAGTGDSLLLGKWNQAGKTTVVKNTGPGPALNLKTKASAPPLAVSSTRKVVRLNADRVDGLDASVLANNMRRYTYASAALQQESTTFRIRKLPAGTYLATIRTSIEPVAVDPGSGLMQTQCVLLAGGVEFAGDMALYAGGFWAILSGADVVRLTRPTDVDVACDVQVDWYLRKPLTVTFTKVSLVSSGGLTKLP